MKRILVALVSAGFCVSVFATPARVLTMGGHDAFFMDETSIFRNPANVSIYPNMLMGSFGEYKVLPVDTSTQNNNNGQYAALKRTSRDPSNPYFGGVMSYSLKTSSEEGNQYPMFSVGAVFNRYDPMLKYLTADTSFYGSVVNGKDSIKNLAAVKPLGKVDMLVGYAFPNGGMIGVGTYLAFQKNVDNKIIKDESSLYRGTLGLNLPVAKSMDLEASLGISSLTLIARDSTLTTNPAPAKVSSNDMTYQADVRLFSALTNLNGDVVPHLGIKYMNLYQGKITNLDIAAGLGLNVNIDKGFFWLGLEGLYKQKKVPNLVSSGVGGRVGFGIERNVVWDWFSVRVGVQKELLYVTENTNTSHWDQNPETDADGDVAAMGIGLNVENRLKFDFVVAEELQNTFSNLLSGSMHHIVTRIDATFSF